MHYAAPDVDDCLYMLTLRSCTVFGNTLYAVGVLQMVPWAGTVRLHPQLCPFSHVNE